MDRAHETRGRDAVLDGLLQRLLELSSRSEVPEREIDAVLDEIYARLAKRSLSGAHFEELYVELTRLGDRDDTGTRVLLTATGLDERGDPEPLAYVSGEVEPAQLSTRLLVDLSRRGLAHVGRIAADPATGIGEIWKAVFPDAEWVAMPEGRRPGWLELPG